MNHSCTTYFSMANSNSLSLTMALSLRSAVEPVDPNVVPEFVKDIITEQCFQVAILTMLVHDARRYFISHIPIVPNGPTSHHL